MHRVAFKYSTELFQELVTSLKATILVCRSSQKPDVVHRLRSATRRVEAQLALLEISQILPPGLDQTCEVRRRLKKLQRYGSRSGCAD